MEEDTNSLFLLLDTVMPHFDKIMKIKSKNFPHNMPPSGQAIRETKKGEDKYLTFHW